MPMACDQMQATWVADSIAATERVVIATEIAYG